MRYDIRWQVTDPQFGWKLEPDRHVPRGFTITVEQLCRVWDREPGTGHAGLEWKELSHAEVMQLRAGKMATVGETGGVPWMIAPRTWLELDVVSDATMPPRCVALRAPGGISSREQRFPIVSLIVEAAARLSRKGVRWAVWPEKLTDYYEPGLVGDEYEDTRSEARRALGRKRPRRNGKRSAITPERLDEVAYVASLYPRTPTRAVQEHFGISRPYAWKLRKMAAARANKNE